MLDIIKCLLLLTAYLMLTEPLRYSRFLFMGEECEPREVKQLAQVSKLLEPGTLCS